MRICNRCNLSKKVVEFYNISTTCKICTRLREKTKRDNDPIVIEKRKKLIDKNALFKLGKIVCSKCVIEYPLTHYSSELKGWNGLRSDCNFCKNKRVANWNAKTGAKRKYMANYLKDINHRLADNLRSRLRKAIKNNQKTGSAVKNLGCSIKRLKEYLENKFTEGMTWDNYGLKGWHIDHVKPLSSFDLTKAEELKKAVHYTNLQPLWAKDNLSKGAKYDE
jgi:hypothetical protein